MFILDIVIFTNFYLHSISFISDLLMERQFYIDTMQSKFTVTEPKMHIIRWNNSHNALFVYSTSFMFIFHFVYVDNVQYLVFEPFYYQIVLNKKSITIFFQISSAY